MKAALAFRVQALASRRLSSCVGFFFFFLCQETTVGVRRWQEKGEGEKW